MSASARESVSAAQVYQKRHNNGIPNAADYDVVYYSTEHQPDDHMWFLEDFWYSGQKWLILFTSFEYWCTSYDRIKLQLVNTVSRTKNMNMRDYITWHKTSYFSDNNSTLPIFYDANLFKASKEKHNRVHGGKTKHWINQWLLIISVDRWTLV